MNILGLISQLIGIKTLRLTVCINKEVNAPSTVTNHVSVKWSLKTKSFGVLRPMGLRPFHASGSNRGYGVHLLIVWNKS